MKITLKSIPAILIAVFFMYSMPPSIAQPPVSAVIEANNVRGVINTNGILFNDGQQGHFIPLHPELAKKSLMGYSGLWIVGQDPAGNLKGAVVLNGHTDYNPGLMDTTLSELNSIWKVSCADIDQHLTDFQDNGVVDNPNAGVFAYPARGNPYFEQYNSATIPFTPQGLAEFYDYDGNNNYTPGNGDFPATYVPSTCNLIDDYKELYWLVFNDSGTHPSGMTPLQVEVQTQFYAFKIESNSPVNNAIFAKYKIINFGSDKIDSCFIGILADFDIGNPNDDFMGTIPEYDILYGYNGDNNDEGGFGANIPVIAVDLLDGPTTEIGSAPLGNAMILNSIENSLWPHQYYNLLKGQFANGLPAPNGGIMYPGNPNIPGEVSEVTAGNTPGTRVGLMSFGPVKIMPGYVQEFSIGYYYVHTPDATPLQNVQQLYDISGTMQNYFESCFGGLDHTCDIMLSSADYTTTTSLLLYPNPTAAEFTIECKGETLSCIQLIDILGRTVRTIELGQPLQQYVMQVADLHAGMYIVRANGQTIPLVVTR